MQKLFILILCLFFGHILQAQSLSGHISDSATHRAIGGASVYFLQLHLGAVTDNNGKYQISNLPEGTYEVEIQVLGHSSLIEQVNLKGDATLDFVSPVSLNSLKPV